MNCLHPLKLLLMALHFQLEPFTISHHKITKCFEQIIEYLLILSTFNLFSSIKNFAICLLQESCKLNNCCYINLTSYGYDHITYFINQILYNDLILTYEKFYLQFLFSDSLFFHKRNNQAFWLIYN